MSFLNNQWIEEPREEDCCHNGCSSCVFDIYAKAIEQWESGHLTPKHFRYDLLSPTHFKPFVLIKVRNITASTNLYAFKPKIQENDNTKGFLPYTTGQHMSLWIKQGNLKYNSPESLIQPLIRHYSIISLTQENNDCTFEVLIKLYESSSTSDFIKGLEVGDITYWRGPYGDYKYHPNKYPQLMILCMGSGIAPVYAITKEILNNENDETVIKLLYGCRNSSDIILRKELGELCSYWNFNCKYYLSEEHHQGNKFYNEDFILGRITSLHISNEIHKECFFLICGSLDFINDMSSNLRELSIPENMVYIF